MTVNALLCKAPLIVLLALPWPRAGPPADAAVVMTRSEQPAPGRAAATPARPAQPIALIRSIREHSPASLVRFSGGWLSVEAKNARLAELLDEVARLAGFVVVSDAAAPQRVTVAFERLSLEQGLLAIIKDQNYLLVWQDARLGAMSPRMLWLVSNAQRTPAHPASAAAAGAPDARSLSAADAQAAQWLAAISNGSPDVREQFATDLGQRRNTAAIGPLARALADSDPGVRRAAIESLARIGGADAARALAPALRDGNARIREAAVDALGDISGPTSLELLRQAQRDVSSFVRHAADETLETLAAGSR